MSLGVYVFEIRVLVLVNCNGVFVYWGIVIGYIDVLRFFRKIGFILINDSYCLVVWFVGWVSGLLEFFFDVLVVDFLFFL